MTTKNNNEIITIRKEMLRYIDAYICNKIGDEEVWITWITLGVPDCYVEDDLLSIAEDEESFWYTMQLGAKLIKRAIEE